VSSAVKKRRQHYVWQYYLKAWATDDTVACLRDGRVFRTGTINLALETDFYRLRELTPAELSVVDEFIKNSPENIRNLQRGWLPRFTAVFELSRRLGEVGPPNPELSAALDEAINNLEEDLHSFIETETIPHIDSLRARDLSFFDSATDVTGFLHFLAVQYLRTNKMRSDTIAALSGVRGIEVANMWGLLSHILATNFSYSLLSNRKDLRVTLLDHGDGPEFITADQPLINLRAVGLPPEMQAQDLLLYYPISPSTALLLAPHQPPGGMQQRTLQDSESRLYNQAMFDFSHSQVYARREEDLRSPWVRPREGSQASAWSGPAGGHHT